MLILLFNIGGEKDLNLRPSGYESDALQAGCNSSNNLGVFKRHRKSAEIKPSFFVIKFP